MLNVRSEFPLLRRTINDRPIVYLDSAATSLKPQCVIDAVVRFYTEHTANVHRAIHTLSEEATDAFEATRSDLASLINADDDELIFVRGTTDGCNLLRRALPNVKRIAVTAMEHHSNFLPWWDGDRRPRVVGVDAAGLLDLDDLDAALREGVELLTVSHVSNVLGVVNPINEIIKKAHAAGAQVLVDAAQSAPHMAIDVRAMDADYLTFSGHKMLGPGGTGVLYVRRDHMDDLSPVQLGGNTVDQVTLAGYTMQEPPHRFEAGTPAIEAIIGWGAAARFLDDLDMNNVREHDRELVACALDRLADIPKLHIVGPTDPSSRCGSVAFRVEGLEAHGVARMLSNRANIFVRSGFHCAQPLHESLGLPPTIRASFQVYNTTDDIDALATSLRQIVAIL